MCHRLFEAPVMTGEKSNINSLRLGLGLGKVSKSSVAPIDNNMIVGERGGCSEKEVVEGE